MVCCPLNSQKTPHTTPFRASYGVSFMSTSTEIDRVIKGFYCIVYCMNSEASDVNVWQRVNAFTQNIPLKYSSEFVCFVLSGYVIHIHRLMQDRRNSSALAMELRVSCWTDTGPIVWFRLSKEHLKNVDKFDLHLTIHHKRQVPGWVSLENYYIYGFPLKVADGHILWSHIVFVMWNPTVK